MLNFDEVMPYYIKRDHYPACVSVDGGYCKHMMVAALNMA